MAIAAQFHILLFVRDAPEPTGEELDDADLEAPKIYEPVASLLCLLKVDLLLKKFVWQDSFIRLPSRKA